MSDLSYRLVELAENINFDVGSWQDFGYEMPPTPDAHPIPPLGERSAANIQAGHSAIKTIDELMQKLHGLRAQLVGELRQDEDIRMATLDAKYGPLNAR